MTGQQRQHVPDRRTLVSAFAGHVSAARAGGGAKILAAVLVAALAGGVVMGVGYMTRPAKGHHAAASVLAGRTAAPGPGAAGRQSPAAQAAAPSQAPPSQAAPAQQPPGTQSAPGNQPAPSQPVTSSPGPGQSGIAAASPRASGPPSAPARAHASPAPSQSAAAANQADGQQRFAAVTGYGCPSTGQAAFTEHGRWTDGLNGFISVHSRGLNTDGCDGSFDAMPMSGSTTYDDPGNYALWTFHTAPVVRGTCHINVYVPTDTNVEHVGGHPADYQVFGSAGTSGPELGAFDVDQIFNRGRWASRHNWPITNGTLTVKLDSYGIDWSGNSPTHAHIAISAVSLTCAS